MGLLDKLYLTLVYLTHYQTEEFKAFADNEIYVTQKLRFVFGKVKNIGEKGENASYTVFSKAVFLRVFKTEDCLAKGLKANGKLVFCLNFLFPQWFPND